MEKILKRIFDYQRFSPNKRLSAIISEIESRYRVLDDEKLSLISAKLNAISPLATLSRGYAIAKNGSGDTVNSVSAIKQGDELSVVLSDGEILAEVKKTKEDQKN